MAIEFDEYGPENVLQVYDAKTKLWGVTVIDNTSLGPGKGGIRFAPGVTVEEVARLARAMTWKNALAGLPFGGAKSGICVKDVKSADKNALIRAFARGLKPFIPSRYIAGPDMNTTEKDMAAFAEEVGTPKAATGKPLDKGGLPHELGSTGFGVAKSALATLDLMDIEESEATVVLEGFGNVGSFASRFLSEAGCKIIAVSDLGGMIVDEKGLDIPKLVETKRSKGTVTAYSSPTAVVNKDFNSLFSLDCTVLIPGARPDSINEGNKRSIRTKLLVEAANIPVSEAIEGEFWRKGIVFVPDIIANAGGVISSYVEFIGGNEKQMFATVEEKIVKNTREVMQRALESKNNPRKIALETAKERVNNAAKNKVH